MKPRTNATVKCLPVNMEMYSNTTEYGLSTIEHLNWIIEDDEAVFTHPFDNKLYIDLKDVKTIDVCYVGYGVGYTNRVTTNKGHHVYVIL